MRVGEYLVVVRDEAGRQLTTYERTATTSHPIRGDELEIDSVAYEVVKVRHVDEPGSTRRRYTTANVFVRPKGGAACPPTPPSGPPSPPTSDSGSNVIEFRRVPRDHEHRVESIVLPVTLIAALVACGYRAQANHYRRLCEETAFLERARGESAVKLLGSHAHWWRESRKAKQHAFEAQQLAERMAAPRAKVLSLAA